VTQIAFRPVDVVADLALVHGWMQEPHVAPWWELAGPDELVRDYLRRQAALAHLDCWIVSEDARPVAYVETYQVSDDPLARHYDAQPGDCGFHLLVGPPELLGTGLAQRLVRHLVSFLLGRSGITRIVCEPDVRNARMLAFCRSLGGEQLAEFDIDGRRVTLIAWCRPDQVAAA
jgi:acetyl CoA:N6-hydroxylysine acetyl transferase